MGQSESSVKVTARDKAILDVKVQRDRLKQYQKKMTIITERETQIAKEHMTKGNKQLAMLALKKRNYQQGLLDKTQDQLLNLEQLVQSIEFSQVQAQVFEGLKTGNTILSELQQEMKIEDVELLMEETAEAIAYQNELSQMLSGTTEVQIDEDELLQELDALQEEEAVKLDFAIPAAPKNNLEFFKSSVVKEQKEEQTEDLEPEREAELA